MNKERLQTYNERLSNNNVSIEEIKNKINELPDASKPTQNKEVTPTKEEQIVIADEGYSLGQVNVNAIPDNYIEPDGTLEITENGVHNVTKYKEANVNIKSSSSFAPRYVTFRGYTGTELDEETRNLDTSNMTSLISMFQDTSLKRLDLSNFNTENVTTIEALFYGSRSLESINLSGFNTSKVTTMTNAFADMPKLKNLDISDFDMSKVEALSYIFNGTSLETFRLGTNLGKGYTQKRNNYSRYKLDLSASNLDHDSLMDVINKLYDLNLTYDVANGGTLYTQQLVLGSTNIAKLSSDELAVATNKNWVVS